MKTFELPQLTIEQARRYLSGEGIGSSTPTPAFSDIKRRLDKTHYTAMELYHYLTYYDKTSGHISVTWRGSKPLTARWPYFLSYKRDRVKELSDIWAEQEHSFGILQRREIDMLTILMEPLKDLGPVFRLEKLYEYESELDPLDVGMLEAKYSEYALNILLGSPEYKEHCPRVLNALAEERIYYDL